MKKSKFSSNNPQIEIMQYLSKELDSIHIFIMKKLGELKQCIDLSILNVRVSKNHNQISEKEEGEIK